jgi:hypothetical protein
LEASQSASNASSSASSASQSASTASEHASAAQQAKSAMDTLFDNFDDRFLGAKTQNPTTDNDGNALSVGAVHYNTTESQVRFWNGASWDSPSESAATSASTASTKANEASQSADAAAQSLAAAQGLNYSDGDDGDDGKGWTSGAYNPSSGVVTFSSDDGLGFSTQDLRGAPGTPGSDFQYSDFTTEQLAYLKGERGDAFEYSDFTQAQLDLLKGANGTSPTLSFNNGVLTITNT